MTRVFVAVLALSGCTYITIVEPSADASTAVDASSAPDAPDATSSTPDASTSIVDAGADTGSDALVPSVVDAGTDAGPPLECDPVATGTGAESGCASGFCLYGEDDAAPYCGVPEATAGDTFVYREGDDCGLHEICAGRGLTCISGSCRRMCWDDSDCPTTRYPDCEHDFALEGNPFGVGVCWYWGPRDAG